MSDKIKIELELTPAELEKLLPWIKKENDLILYKKPPTYIKYISFITRATKNGLIELTVLDRDLRECLNKILINPSNGKVVELSGTFAG